MAKALHACSVCGKTCPWGPTWTWYGSITELEGGKDVPKFCSAACAELGGIQVPEELTEEQKEAYRSRAAEIIAQQNAEFETDPGAAISDGMDGAWVQCWVWVGKDEVEP